MKILIIGAGWYGCHLALSLKNDGYDVILVDKTNDIFAGSSLKNQNRLHLGFHYPRSPETIRECQEGYPLFLSHYLELTESVPNNIYTISKSESLLTLDSYKKAIIETGCGGQEYTPSRIPFDVQNIEDTVYLVNERYINPHKAASYFKENLTIVPLPSESFTSIRAIRAAIGTPVDLVFNCTYNQLEPIDFERYELFVTFLYKIDTPSTFALTMMDGPFFSIYPYDIEQKIYTVTHVKHCILYAGKDVIPLTDISLEEVRYRVESDISRFIPHFTEMSTLVGHYTSWKTKPYTVSDDRSLRYKIQGDIISMYGGKITGIFQAEQLARSILADYSHATE